MGEIQSRSRLFRLQAVVYLGNNKGTAARRIFNLVRDFAFTRRIRVILAANVAFLLDRSPFSSSHFPRLLFPPPPPPPRSAPFYFLSFVLCRLVFSSPPHTPPTPLLNPSLNDRFIHSIYYCFVRSCQAAVYIYKYENILRLTFCLYHRPTCSLHLLYIRVPQANHLDLIKSDNQSNRISEKRLDGNVGVKFERGSIKSAYDEARRIPTLIESKYCSTKRTATRPVISSGAFRAARCRPGKGPYFRLLPLSRGDRAAARQSQRKEQRREIHLHTGNARYALASDLEALRTSTRARDRGTHTHTHTYIHTIEK